MGGYSVLRLVLSDNFHLGGILYSDLDCLTIFMGGYSVLGLVLSDNFHFGGVFCTRTWTL